MTALPQEIIALVTKTPGLTDREIATLLRGKSAPQQPVNIAARTLAARGNILRIKRADGLIGNYPATIGNTLSIPPRPIPRPPEPSDDLSKDNIKHHLREWLNGCGWEIEVAWGRDHGIDVRAYREGQRWMIEVKGIGSLPAMRVNYFLGILGETLQRMEDPEAKYSICLPDVSQFRKLWTRLPRLAKQRTGITALFVSSTGQVTEMAE